jgi:multidrug efflux pump subunit AcrB
MYGQSARAIEMEATSRIEAMLNRIKGVQGVNSRSYNGGGHISVRLSKHVDADMAKFEVSTIIRQLWPMLPEGVSYPSISMSGTNSGTSQEIVSPFLRYTVNAPFAPIRIQEYIEENLKPKLAEIPGIDRIDVFGAGRMIYKLEYDYTLLQNLGISVGEIQLAIRSYLVGEFLGTGKIIDENSESQWIRLAMISEDRSQFFDPSTIQVKNINGRIIYLDNLVKTTYEEEEVASYFRINGLNSIYLSITAKENVNQLALSEQVQMMLKNYQATMPFGYELHLLYDAGEYIQDEMDKIYFRSGLTVLILLCFVFIVYRDLKYSLMIIFSLTVNIAVAVIFYYLCGLEMQLYSLAGLTISLNLIIDNAIVMSDQIIHRGNRKAFMAILAATLTSVGALAVILFMDEKARTNLQDFTWIIIINLIVSLFIALLFVPAMIDRLRLEKSVKKAKKTGIKRFLVYMNRIYEKIIRGTQRVKAWIIAVLILSFGLPMFLLPDKVGENAGFLSKFYNQTFNSDFYKENIKPVSDIFLGGTLRLFVQEVRNNSYISNERSETALIVTSSLSNGSSKEQMDAVVRKMENYIKQFVEIRQFETHIESGQRANIRILFKKQFQRSTFPYALRSRLIGKSLELGGGSWGIYGVGDGFSNDVKEHAGSSGIKLLGYNYDELCSLSEIMKDSLQQYDRVKNVTIDSRFSWYTNDYTEFVFDMDREGLVYNDMKSTELYQSFSPLFVKNVRVGDWIHVDKIESIRLYAKQAYASDIWNMKNSPIKIGEREFKIGDVAQIRKWQAPQDISKENQQYLLCVQYQYVGSSKQANKVKQACINSFNTEAPLGYKAVSDTSWYWHGNSASRQYRLLFLIIAIIYFVSSVLFDSLVQPLIIIFIIPVSYIGLFLTFYLFELNFDQGGFAAFILLTAISVNANIYILNEYNNIRNKCPHMRRIKVYIKAWNVKIIPVFLTVFSTVLGFMPFMIGKYKEPFWFPLAAGTIGGLIVSFILMSLFLPLFMGVGKTRNIKY